MRLADSWMKRAKRCEVPKNTFLFLKTINFTFINVIRYQLKSLKCSFISSLEAIQIRHYHVLIAQKLQNQCDL